MRIAGFLFGLVVLMATLANVFTTLVVPRATSSRMLRVISKGLVTAVRPLLRRTSTYEAKDRIMAKVGPLGMVLLFVVWLVLLVIAFGFIAWWPSGTNLAHALAVAGSSVFTLGIANETGHGSEGIEFIAAGTGLLVIALEIAYLPTLYSAFSARETEITLLGTRAGIPAWGPEILARHHWFKTTSELPDLFRSWERWAAAVTESHTNYPSLMWFRSPVPWRFWLTAMTAMLDAAALNDALRPASAPGHGRVYLQMGTNCLRGLGRVLRVDFDADPLPTTPIRLTYEEYLDGVRRLEEVGYEFERTPEEAWPHFSGWRINYEAIVDALTLLVMPPPAPWFLARPGMGATHFPRVLNRTPDDPHASNSAEGGDELGGNVDEGVAASPERLEQEERELGETDRGPTVR